MFYQGAVAPPPRHEFQFIHNFCVYEKTFGLKEAEFFGTLIDTNLKSPMGLFAGLSEGQEARIAQRVRVCGARRLCKRVCEIVLRHRPPNRHAGSRLLSSNQYQPAQRGSAGAIGPATISFISV